MPQPRNQSKKTNVPKVPGVVAILGLAAERAANELPALIAQLADRHGILPNDVLLHPDCRKALQQRKINPATVPHSLISQAHGLFRRGITESMALVDAHNARMLARNPLLAESLEAVGGDVCPRRLTTVDAPSAGQQAGDAPPPTKSRILKPGNRGVEILGQPATAVLRLMGKLKFPFPDARLAMDELGGRGLSDSTIRLSLARWEENHVAELSPEQLAELESFRGKGIAEDRQERGRAPREAVVAKPPKPMVF